ncbi:hypothetical protein [Halomonas sp.]|uniref:hypothetical protein n=1 Tax=Halomonas sp. TaxID=1486246 RepID=UPI00298EC0C2|nr:hypothetical protein [Halomonas sp.]MDW7746742.1 hypothetical protein [Halomonas sp.]
MAQQNPQFNLRLEPEVKAWLDVKSKQKRLSRTWLVNNAIKEAMRHDQQATAQK